MNIKMLHPHYYTISKWSGGTTTQLFIYPQSSSYAERNFLFRISSATVETETSVFTALPDYQRFITPLCGTLVLSHNQATPITLTPLEINFFHGAWHTQSHGIVTDFNLMVREGYIANMVIINCNSNENVITIHPHVHYFIYICSDTVIINGNSIPPGNALYITSDLKETITYSAPLSTQFILCSIEC